MHEALRVRAARMSRRGESIDAENNWWGCATGANTGGCDSASASISTTPFLALPSETAPCEPLAEPRSWQRVKVHMQRCGSVPARCAKSMSIAVPPLVR